MVEKQRTGNERVRVPPALKPTKEAIEQKAGSEEDSSGELMGSRPVRQRRPNAKYCEPEWTS